MAEAAALGEDVLVIDFFSAKVLFPFFLGFFFFLSACTAQTSKIQYHVFIVVVGFALRGEIPQLPNPKGRSLWALPQPSNSCWNSPPIAAGDLLGGKGKHILHFRPCTNQTMGNSSRNSWKSAPFQSHFSHKPCGCSWVCGLHGPAVTLWDGFG